MLYVVTMFQQRNYRLPKLTVFQDLPRLKALAGQEAGSSSVRKCCEIRVISKGHMTHQAIHDLFLVAAIPLPEKHDHSITNANILYNCWYLRSS